MPMHLTEKTSCVGVEVMQVTLSLLNENGAVRFKRFEAQDEEPVDLPEKICFPTFL